MSYPAAAHRGRPPLEEITWCVVTVRLSSPRSSCSCCTAAQLLKMPSERAIDSIDRYCSGGYYGKCILRPDPKWGKFFPTRASMFHAGAREDRAPCAARRAPRGTLRDQPKFTYKVQFNFIDMNTSFPVLINSLWAAQRDCEAHNCNAEWVRAKWVPAH